MPGAESSNPPSANDSSASDEASLLELHLRRQLEEDVARIFDESIYSDLELVCGRLKVLTHSCILRARTDDFYRVLDTLLHVNIGRSAFEEVYSFISDTYTECNIKHQEKEILHYLKSISSSFNNKKGVEEPEEPFLTPKCVSPYIEKGYQKTVSSSPSTELTKEYYSLVPIENNLLDKELIEQDELSSAFQSIISSQSGGKDNINTFQRSKPTSLALVSSHSPKSVKHSNSDTLINSNLQANILFGTEKEDDKNKEVIAPSQKESLVTNKSSDNLCKNKIEKVEETAYSPDSLITDDLSSSSDYLSAAYAGSPGAAPACALQLNVESHIAKMENIFTSSDSGLENTGLLESLTSHRDVTLTDMSLTESTLHELTTDDGSNSHDSSSNPFVEKEMLTRAQPDASMRDSNSQTSHNSERPNEYSCHSSKEEKQRQNEEIVILESSSLSSETGSWESVFPPKLPTKEVCEKFIHNEKQYFDESVNQNASKKITQTTHEPTVSFADNSQMSVTQSTFKSGSCFIDAASLADEEDDANKVVQNLPSDAPIPVPSQPVPCSTNRTDISPSDWSENDNEDSLEQLDSKDQDSIQKDLSPTIFEMTPITEDSLCTNAFEQNQKDCAAHRNKEVSSNLNCEKDDSILSNTVFVSNTPHNSILSLKASTLKQYESEESESDITITGRESQSIIQNCQKYSESSPIISGGVSVEDHLPSIGSYSGSPLVRRRIENIPIVSGAYSYVAPAEVEKQVRSPRPSCANAWVVDMSSSNKAETGKSSCDQTNNAMRPTDKVGFSLRNSSNSTSLENCSKSRSSVDSDGSERSSQKFYIDLSTLPNNIPPQNQTESKNANEKKNMFSMYIDISEKPTAKEIPPKLNAIAKNTKTTKSQKTAEPQKTTEPHKTSDPHKTTEPLKTTAPLKTNEPQKTIEPQETTELQKTTQPQKTAEPQKNPKKNRMMDIRCQQMFDAVAKAPNTKCRLSISEIFERYEYLCANPNLTIAQILSVTRLPEVKPEEVNSDDHKDTESKQEIEDKKVYDRNPHSAHEKPVTIPEKPVAIPEEPAFLEEHVTIPEGPVTIPEEPVTIHEEPVTEQEAEPFVRLSDLDKPVQKADPPIVKNPVKTLGERMTRSIPDNNWCEQPTQASTSRSNEIVSSFHSENALSLNRLFPHLRNEFSRSMPGSLSSRTRSPLRSGVCSSPGDMDDQASDSGSEMSSVHSSFCRSNFENSITTTTDEISQASSLMTNCQSRLGQDLLRMFLEEIAPDVIVEVSGRRIKAHKCILSSRCQYFAGILSGGWVESAGNVIALPPFSYSVVHFALCHIYSGVSIIPDAISIVELATLADMLGLEGLKEAIMFTLKAKYCHHFHEPCAVCKAGVLECFPLCSVYGLDDLYKKCLDWIIKYFPWVFPTKAFATLPTELLDKCYQELVSILTLDNVIGKVYAVGLTGICMNAEQDLTRVRWGEVVLRLCRRVIHAAAHLIAPNLTHVLRELGDMRPDPPPNVKKTLDECMAAAIDWAPPNLVCDAYHMLSGIAKDIRNRRFARPDLINNGSQDLVPIYESMLYVCATDWVPLCENALVRAGPQIVCTPAFQHMPPELRRRLRELGCITLGGQPPLPGSAPAPIPNRRPRSTQQSRPNRPTNNSTLSRNAEIDQVRASFVPYAQKPKVDGSFTLGLQEAIRLSYNNAAPQVRTTRAQEERAKFNLSKTKTTSQEQLNAKVPSKPFEKTKPRYLEPKVCPENCKKMQTAPKSAKTLSSSESSRNSSPVQTRNLRTSRMKTRQANEATKPKALSQDSLPASVQRPRPSIPINVAEVITTANQYLNPRVRARYFNYIKSELAITKQKITLEQKIALGIDPSEDANADSSTAVNAAPSAAVNAEPSAAAIANPSTAANADLPTAANADLPTTANAGLPSATNPDLPTATNADLPTAAKVYPSEAANAIPSMAANVDPAAASTTESSTAGKAQPLTAVNANPSKSARTESPKAVKANQSTAANANALKAANARSSPAANANQSPAANANSAAAANTKLKTKIPVYSNSMSKSQSSEKKSSSGTTTKASTTTTTNSSASLPLRNKAAEKNSSCSLMNATKSSQAKMVTKVVKGSGKTKPAPKSAKNSSKRPQRRGDEPPADIPVMERSGTFLKDEPTFGDKTKNIDLE